jgi:hypothetical protein
MDRIYDLATVFRSKNAGPLYITFDLLFADEASYRRVKNCKSLRPTVIAELYGLEPADVKIIHFDAVNGIKVTIPRKGPTSGAPGDRDVYGAQQHLPLLNLMVP